MTFSDPPSGTGGSLVESLFTASLPETHCDGCGSLIMRRQPRMMLRASWRDCQESLCPGCWGAIVQWAQRFALQQLELPLST